MYEVLLYYLIAINVIAFIMYGIDKSRTIRHGWRITETTLIGIAFIGDGVRKTTRYQEIDVVYQDIDFKKHRQSFSGFIAEIIQHECDHLEGILI